AAATHFAVRIPAGVTAGTETSVQLSAQDDDNRFVSDFSGTVDLSSSDADATLPASVTFVHGHATVQVTFANSGQQSLTATDETDPTIVGTATTNVAEPDVATHFVMYLPSGATANSPVTVHLVAEDSVNEFVSTYNGTVDLTSSDGGAMLPA